MDFNEVVETVVESVPGGIASVVMAADGISLADYIKPGASVDIQTLGIEYTAIIAEIKKAAEVLKAGEMEELTVRTDQLLFLVRLITDEYFIALALKPGGNCGKGRYLLRIKSQCLAEEF
ncbi:MAG: roadblock/LC7 domain-containing protein [Proteobacteria bacterium]|nr:roadblock/LC7 domain-containing protein [Pseudomonadota bacterium]